MITSHSCVPIHNVAEILNPLTDIEDDFMSSPVAYKLLTRMLLVQIRQAEPRFKYVAQVLGVVVGR